MVLQCSEIWSWEKFAEVIDVLGTCAHVSLAVLTFIMIYCNKMSFVFLLDPSSKYKLHSAFSCPGNAICANV